VPLIELLYESGCVERARILLEKPFGTDLVSARGLNDAIHRMFDEEHVFRIDHYLGKEAALNILALRFANGLFEPIWSRTQIDHVQIDVPETLGVDGRAGFYEQAGAFRDMVVTHLMQILAFVAMEPPTSLEPESITIEKNKVFRSLRPLDPSCVVRGRYSSYEGKAETMIALRCEVDNWRWAGVPFFLRTGKRMAEGSRIISVTFREPPQSMFPSGSGLGAFGADHLTFDLDESARLSLSFYGKRPGPGMMLDKQSMQFSLQETDASGGLEAYQRLIRDAMIGDRTLFTTADGIERLWEISQPLLDADVPVLPYEPGSWGPERVHDVIAPRRWRLPFERRWRG
jgi:glucose-6-phosphate 1-dehydrogenase